MIEHNCLVRQFERSLKVCHAAWIAPKLILLWNVMTTLPDTALNSSQIDGHIRGPNEKQNKGIAHSRARFIMRR